MITVWQFDDLWDEGYRFDDIVTKRYCFVPRELAKNEIEATDILSRIYKYIKKHQGTSKQTFVNTQMFKPIAVLVIEDDSPKKA